MAEDSRTVVSVGSATTDGASCGVFQLFSVIETVGSCLPMAGQMMEGNRVKAASAATNRRQGRPVDFCHRKCPLTAPQPSILFRRHEEPQAF